MDARGPLIAGNNLEVNNNNTKIKINGIAATRPSPPETFGTSPVCLTAYAGSLGGMIFAQPMITAMITMDAEITDNSGPITALITVSGTANAKPESNVTRNTPFNALIPPPIIITTKNGAIRLSKNNCTEMNVPKWLGSRFVKDANVVVGIPIEPNVVGTEFATRHAMIDLSGSKPTATIIAAGIATAVPKPAIPSMKAPKPHASSNASTRVSDVTEESMVLIVSIAFVCTTKL